MATQMVKLNAKLKEAQFSVGQNGLDWFGRRGKEIAVKRWRDDRDEPGVLCRSLDSERARQGTAKPRGQRTRCESAIAEAVKNNAAVYVAYSYRRSGKNGSQESVWPRDEPLDLVRVEPVYVAGAWLVGDQAAAPDVKAGDTVKATQELQQVLRKVRKEQRAFAKAVFDACCGRCIITGTTAGAVLDAAHRPGRSWEDGHNAASDGWLLRADVHKALDAGLIKISAEGQLVRCDQPVAYIEEAFKSIRGTRS